MVHPSAIPALAQGIKPVGAVLAAESLPRPVRLVGDVAALSLINRAPVKATAPVLAAPPVLHAVPSHTIVSAAAPALSYAASAPLSASLSASGSGIALSGSGLASGSYSY